MSWPTDHELEVLVARFRDRTLGKPEWTHAAHLAVGAWHVHRLGGLALPAVREGIIRLNEAHGTANTDSSGYHETVTRAYLTLITGHLATLPAETGPGALARSVLAGQLAARDVLLAYYSRDRLMSTAARRGWVLPDRSPLVAPVHSEPADPDRAGKSGVT